jgi:hypothetical protein
MMFWRGMVKVLKVLGTYGWDNYPEGQQFSRILSAVLVLV